MVRSTREAWDPNPQILVCSKKEVSLDTCSLLEARGHTQGIPALNGFLLASDGQTPSYSHCKSNFPGGMAEPTRL